MEPSRGSSGPSAFGGNYPANVTDDGRRTGVFRAQDEDEDEDAEFTSLSSGDEEEEDDDPSDLPRRVPLPSDEESPPKDMYQLRERVLREATKQRREEEKEREREEQGEEEKEGEDQRPMPVRKRSAASYLEKEGPTKRESQRGDPKLGDDDQYGKYFKMLTMGLNKDRVKLRMVQEGVNPNILDMDPEMTVGEFSLASRGQSMRGAGNVRPDKEKGIFDMFKKQGPEAPSRKREAGEDIEKEGPTKKPLETMGQLREALPALKRGSVALERSSSKRALRSDLVGDLTKLLRQKDDPPQALIDFIANHSYLVHDDYAKAKEHLSFITNQEDRESIRDGLVGVYLQGHVAHAYSNIQLEQLNLMIANVHLAWPVPYEQINYDVLPPDFRDLVSGCITSASDAARRMLFLELTNDYRWLFEVNSVVEDEGLQTVSGRTFLSNNLGLMTERFIGMRDGPEAHFYLYMLRYFKCAYAAMIIQAEVKRRHDE